MQIKYPPLISVTADLRGAKYLVGNVVIDAAVRGKPASLVLSRDEAENLVKYLKAALATAPKVS
jgi:hypothetical protein